MIQTDLKENIWYILKSNIRCLIHSRVEVFVSRSLSCMLDKMCEPKEKAEMRPRGARRSFYFCVLESFMSVQSFKDGDHMITRDPVNMNWTDGQNDDRQRLPVPELSRDHH